MLSAKSRRLYRRLLELGPIPRSEAKANGVDDDVLAELLDYGLVREILDRLSALPPRAARGQVAMLANERAREVLKDAAATEAFLDACSRLDQRSEPTSDGSPVELIEDHAELRLLSSTLERDAKRDVRSVQTARFPSWASDSCAVNVSGPIESDRKAGIRYRVIYARELLEDAVRRRKIETFVAHGEDARAHLTPPLKFKIIDESAAFLPLDETVEDAALLVRSRQICGLLVDYFEMLWAESVPIREINQDMARASSVTDLRVLASLADDASDASIARRLNLSERSVRRHVNSLLATFGVQTRTGIVAAAVRRGWLP